MEIDKVSSSLQLTKVGDCSVAVRNLERPGFALEFFKEGELLPILEFSFDNGMDCRLLPIRKNQVFPVVAPSELLMTSLVVEVLVGPLKGKRFFNNSQGLSVDHDGIFVDLKDSIFVGKQETIEEWETYVYRFRNFEVNVTPVWKGSDFAGCNYSVWYENELISFGDSIE
jgi:hypothetical protein